MTVTRDGSKRAIQRRLHSIYKEAADTIEKAGERRDRFLTFAKRPKSIPGEPQLRDAGYALLGLGQLGGKLRDTVTQLGIAWILGGLEMQRAESPFQRTAAYETGVVFDQGGSRNIIGKHRNRSDTPGSL